MPRNRNKQARADWYESKAHLAYAALANFKEISAEHLARRIGVSVSTLKGVIAVVRRRHVVYKIGDSYALAEK
jgi:hypothetical protein